MHPLPPPRGGLSSQPTEPRDRTSMNPPNPDHTAASSATGEGQLSTVSTAAADGKKKRKHRGGKKRRNRRQSFAAPSETSAMESGRGAPTDDPLLEEAQPPST